MYRDRVVNAEQLEAARNWRLKNPNESNDVTDTQLAMILAKLGNLPEEEKS